MKVDYFKYILVLLIAVSCKSNKVIKNSTWEKFKTAINEKDYSYLVENSLDSIRCIDCVIDESEKLQSSENVFKKHIDKFYNKNLLNNKDYTVFENEKGLKINYSFENGAESSNIIYVFENKNKKHLLSGMITVP